jgi:hypothetical protein
MPVDLEMLPIILKVGSKAKCDLNQIGHATVEVHFSPGLTTDKELILSRVAKCLTSSIYTSHIYKVNIHW